MKKLLTLMIAAVLLLGCVNVTAYADEKITTIKATVAAVAYEIVVPVSVNMSAPGIIRVAQPTVKDVTGASANTVISYTAKGTDFTLSGGSKTMKASYYSDLAGTTPFPTTAIEVYKNKAVVSTLPDIYVGVTEDDWYAATPGTYTATITFDFNSSNYVKPEKMTISDILKTVSGFPTTEENGWSGTNDGGEVVKAYYNTADDYLALEAFQGSHAQRSVTLECISNANGYIYEADDWSCEFIMPGGILTSIKYTPDKWLFPEEVIVYTKPSN